MNRVRKASVWGAMLVGGLLLASSAVAASKSPEKCKGECVAKANEAMESCVNACPRQPGDVVKDTRFRACMSRCSDKLQSSTKSCDNSCPKSKGTKTP